MIFKTSKVLSMIASFSLMVGSSFVYAEEGLDIESPSVIIESSEPELKWREDLKSAKSARSGFLVTGAVTGIAGIGMMVAGNIKAATAGDVDGCSRDGVFTVTCNTQTQVDQAQSRIDDGKKVMVGWLIVALVGGALLLGGAHQTSKIDAMERKGRQQGFKLSLDQTHNNGFQLKLAKSF